MFQVRYFLSLLISLSLHFLLFFSSGFLRLAWICSGVWLQVLILWTRSELCLINIWSCWFTWLVWECIMLFADLVGWFFTFFGGPWILHACFSFFIFLMGLVFVFLSGEKWLHVELALLAMKFWSCSIFSSVSLDRTMGAALWLIVFSFLPAK